MVGLERAVGGGASKEKRQLFEYVIRSPHWERRVYVRSIVKRVRDAKIVLDIWSIRLGA